MAEKIIGNKYTAVLLAAGYGSRISTLTDRPKCLLELNGKSILQRHFEVWKQLGIDSVHLVVGYKKELILKVIDRYTKYFNFKIIVNEDYTNMGNTHSLYIGIKEIKGACLIFDADLVYDKVILEGFLQEGEQQSSILVGNGNLEDIESAKVLVDANQFVRMTVDKRAVTKAELKKYKFIGEAIGVLKFSNQHTKKLSLSAEDFLAKKSNLILNWEHLLNQFLLQHNVCYHLFNKGPWIEIDTPEDFKQAQRMFSAI